ncbi:MAG: endo alpha-1,4 polygalactosaminidase [Chloroflexi bacterium]|nr:MAG: endo alpha-1,4 polygalactosaminidase [Chloroflexota bacterium]
MKPTTLLLLTFSVLISACATPAESTAEPPTIQPATAPPTSAPPKTPIPATESLAPTEIPPTKEIWLPPLDSSFSWQLGSGEEINTSFDVDIYDLDAFETEASLISRLHSQGKKAFCYISVGSWEDWREDAADFPSEIIGKDYEGWEGEKWLDIRQIDLLAPIMRARLDMCAAKGFDGIEPDNIDLHWADTGFEISYEDQLAYNIWLSEEAHERGLSIGLKNDDEQVLDLLPYFDWALTEDCFMGEWCEEMLPFIEAGKPVFAVEYTDEINYEDFLSNICPQARELGFYVILKNRNLDEFREVCSSE